MTLTFEDIDEEKFQQMEESLKKALADATSHPKEKIALDFVSRLRRRLAAGSVEASFGTDSGEDATALAETINNINDQELISQVNSGLEDDGVQGANLMQVSEATAQLGPYTKEYTFEGDFADYSEVNTRTQFLTDCSLDLSPGLCVDVKSGGDNKIVVTVEITPIH